ncbi:MAG TPA: acetyltransferase [Dongiaceae bacterium]|nr:acetyltransferase [Dongiaceae bacterium]
MRRHDPTNSRQGASPALVVLGASGHAKVVADAVSRLGAYRIVRFFDTTSPERAGQDFCGAPVCSDWRALDELWRQGVRCAFVAIGNCSARTRLGERLLGQGFELPLLIHPAAIVSPSARIGGGTFVAAGAVVGPDCQIGRHVIINSAASVDHDCVLEDGVHVCPRVALGGSVRIGTRSWIGIGATIIEKRNIGRDCLVGAGAVVLADVSDASRVAGCPAKPLPSASPKRSPRA